MRTNEHLREGSKRRNSLEDASVNLFLFGNNAATLASDGVVMPIVEDLRLLNDEYFCDDKNEPEVAGANKDPDESMHNMDLKAPVEASASGARKRKRCSHVGCQKGARYRGKCHQHCGRTCSYQGCDAPIKLRGLCSAHGGIAAHIQAARSGSYLMGYAAPTVEGINVHNLAALSTPNQRACAVSTVLLVRLAARTQAALSGSYRRVCALNMVVGVTAHSQVALTAPREWVCVVPMVE
ncbi:LOW QUALITY PROTEIN: hypothetical protein PHMEG_0007835 [Phytophthora megakarya]|uniref:Uncharacterized protein n=1 Tax=Phytophthora megakarya TaxID=4795 RepID=A0A225WK72_9STRA|nr:LOW QUALITY PROTEIN: hypothetical protein PHMEG_0007835 [Phytophthora megakarya]